MGNTNNKKKKNISVNFEISDQINFPPDVFKWIKINATPRMLFKLMKVCKYFDCQTFPVMYVKNFTAIGDDMIVISYGDKDGMENDRTLNFMYDLTTFPANMWLTGQLWLLGIPYQIPTMIKNSIFIDFKTVHFNGQELSFNEFQLLTAGGNVEEFSMKTTKLFSANGTAVPLEAILNCLPNANEVEVNNPIPSLPCHFTDDDSYPKLQELRLWLIKKSFNIKNYSNFMIKNQNIKYKMSVDGSVPKKYRKKFEKYIGKVIEDWECNNDPPEIRYKNEKLEQQLQNLQKQYLLQKIKQNFVAIYLILMM